MQHPSPTSDLNTITSTPPQHHPPPPTNHTTTSHHHDNTNHANSIAKIFAQHTQIQESMAAQQVAHHQAMAAQQAAQQQQMMQLISSLLPASTSPKIQCSDLVITAPPPHSISTAHNLQSVQFSEAIVEEYVKKSHSEAIDKQLVTVLHKQKNSHSTGYMPPTGAQEKNNQVSHPLNEENAENISKMNEKALPEAMAVAEKTSVLEEEDEVSLAPKIPSTTLPTGTSSETAINHNTVPKKSAFVTSVAGATVAADTTAIPATKSSYASFLRPKATPPPIPITQLPTPYKKGHLMAVKLNEEVYQRSLLQCKNNLHGRLILHRGKSPVKAADLHLSLSTVWNPKNQWSLTPIGKGYYTLRFSNEEDKQKVWTSGQAIIKEGTFNLLQWTPDFKPSKQKHTRAHVWARLHEVPDEYMHFHLLLSMANIIGYPVTIDPHTLKKEFGHYCRVEVDVDLRSTLPSSILVEREDYSFELEVTYEKIPDFCSHCSVIGHLVTECRSLKKAQHDHDNTTKPPSKPPPKSKHYQPKKTVNEANTSTAPQAINAGQQIHDNLTEVVNVSDQPPSPHPLHNKPQQHLLAPPTVNTNNNAIDVHASPHLPDTSLVALNTHDQTSSSPDTNNI